ncbi:MAG: DUF4038 domain-containing protein [Acidimicrobiia bacterium]|nr:DUF4038 domain-containing protein [Acidimicrobiia bacterium]RZV45844.1 MAG: DUF4038 domain-containing protein [Acidimicrobiia bacterium]
MRTVVAALLFALVASLFPAAPVGAAQQVRLWDTAWSLPNNATDAEIEQYLTHLADNGFDGTWVSLAPFTWQGGLSDKIPGTNIAMESFSPPNPAYLARMDFILDEAAERGIQVAVAIAWAADYAGVRPGLQDREPPTPFDDWFDPDDPNNGQKAYDYGFLLGQRWGNHAGLDSWVLGGDYWFGDSEASTAETWSMMAAGLDAAGAPEPKTYGPGGFTSSFNIFAGEPWLDYVSLNQHCLTPAELQSALEALAVHGKPVVAAEVRYEEDQPPFCSWTEPHDADDIRADAEAILASGAVGYVYGHADRWGWYPTAIASLGSPGEQAAIEVLVPDPEPEPEPEPVAEIVLVEPNGLWHVRVDGQPDWTFWYGMPGDTPLLGDWDGDGVATPGMFRSSNGFVYLTNVFPADGSVAVGDPALTFFYGIPGDQVFVGDWNGDGRDSLGISRAGKLFLRNANSTGPADLEFWFGQPDDIAMAGNIDGGTLDEVLLYRPSTGMVYLTNDLPSGDLASTDGSFSVGQVESLAVGDWDGDGIETVGVVDDGEVRLRNSNSSGAPDVTYSWGEPGWVPVAGVRTEAG